MQENVLTEKEKVQSEILTVMFADIKNYAPNSRATSGNNSTSYWKFLMKYQNQFLKSFREVSGKKR